MKFASNLNYDGKLFHEKAWITIMDQCHRYWWIKSRQNTHILIECKKGTLGDMCFMTKWGNFSKKNFSYLISLDIPEHVRQRLWMDDLSSCVVLSFLQKWFNGTTAIASIAKQRFCHASWRVIGWKLSCTCIVTSWSGRQRSKHGVLVHLTSAVFHAYGQIFDIKNAR